MNAQRLDYADGAFDDVVLNLILAVVPDPIQTAREAARVLRPGGRAIIMDKFAPDDGPPLWLRLANPIMRTLATDVTRQLKPILDASGLRIVHEEPAMLHGLFRIALVTRD